VAAVREAMREWAWFIRLVAGLLAALLSSVVFAQASGVQFSGVVCGPQNLAGVTYVQAAGQSVSCGSDSSGNALVLQVSTLANDQPVEGGEQVGLDIGGAMLAVMAAAWGVRALRRMLENGGEGEA
jgi:hypothetical protein